MNHLANPIFLLLLFVPFIVRMTLKAYQKNTEGELKIPFINEIIKINNRTKADMTYGYSFRQKNMAFWILWCVWLLLVLALARPQKLGDVLPVKNEGRDILLVIDISNSMLERDFEYQGRLYDRMSAVKYVVDKFIDARIDDRIGLILFGSRAYMQVPLTYDKVSLKEVLASVDAGMAGNSTSIGDAVGLAVKNIASLDEKKDNKVIILLTDGENNDGKMSFAEALKLAEEEKIKIYTIGAAGTQRAFFGGLFSVPTDTGLDEYSLQQLAQKTNGEYFRAQDVNSLAKVYEKINTLEPQEHQAGVLRQVTELYYIPALLALLLLSALWMAKQRG